MDLRRADGRQSGGRGRVREERREEKGREGTRERASERKLTSFFLPSLQLQLQLQLQHSNSTTSPAPDKEESEIVAEIQAIMRQITACVSFLPLLTRPVSFDLLVYADKDTSVPLEWEDSDARMIEEGSANNVRLRSFTTKVHRVDAMVSYKMEPDELC